MSYSSLSSESFTEVGSVSLSSSQALSKKSLGLDLNLGSDSYILKIISKFNKKYRKNKYINLLKRGKMIKKGENFKYPLFFKSRQWDGNIFQQRAKTLAMPMLILQIQVINLLIFWAQSLDVFLRVLSIFQKFLSKL